MLIDSWQLQSGAALHGWDTCVSSVLNHGRPPGDFQFIEIESDETVFRRQNSSAGKDCVVAQLFIYLFFEDSPPSCLPFASGSRCSFLLHRIPSTHSDKSRRQSRQDSLTRRTANKLLFGLAFKPRPGCCARAVNNSGSVGKCCRLAELKVNMTSC